MLKQSFLFYAQLNKNHHKLDYG